jgi:hypothetical protein
VGGASEQKVAGVEPNFREETSLRAKEANHRSNEKSDESNHGKQLYQNAGTTPPAVLLIPMSAAVLANYNLKSLSHVISALRAEFRI